MLDQKVTSSLSRKTRYPVLDGWRGISILCVLAAHMLPLGPNFLRANEMSARLGMVIFFTLSGFLITGTLIHRSNIHDFLIRRFCRILPLAWLYLTIALPLMSVHPGVYLAHFLFYCNVPPFWLTPVTEHFWSLCVEMQFYLAIAGLVALLKQRGLLLLPALCLMVTGARIVNGEIASIVTVFRVDEILVGACLALVYERRLGEQLPKFLRGVNLPILVGLLVLSCHPASGAAGYFRPYVAATLVGATLYQNKSWLSQALLTPRLTYFAALSYALYIIHPLTMYGWFASTNPFVLYLVKRPLSFLLTFVLAHFSSFYYEKRWIEFGKSWTRSY